MTLFTFLLFDYFNRYQQELTLLVPKWHSVTTNTSTQNNGRGSFIWTGTRIISLSANICFRCTFSRPPLNFCNILLKKGNDLTLCGLIFLYFKSGALLNALHAWYNWKAPPSPARHSNLFRCWPFRHFAKGEILMLRHSDSVPRIHSNIHTGGSRSAIAGRGVLYLVYVTYSQNVYK